MKLIYTAFLALAVLAFAGCGAKKETLPATNTIPTLSVASANDSMKAYAAAVNDYVSAVKAKDYGKIATLTQKVSEQATKVTSITGLKDEDVKKLNDWLTTINTQMSEALTAAAK